MALLKKDGSLDIKWINNLPLEEHIYKVSHLTKEQRKEYISKLPLNEAKKPHTTIYGNLRKELANGELIDAFTVISNL